MILVSHLVPDERPFYLSSSHVRKTRGRLTNRRNPLWVIRHGAIAILPYFGEWTIDPSKVLEEYRVWVARFHHNSNRRTLHIESYIRGPEIQHHGEYRLVSVESVECMFLLPGRHIYVVVRNEVCLLVKACAQGTSIGVF
jgi:hypothetical protein